MPWCAARNMRTIYTDTTWKNTLFLGINLLIFGKIGTSPTLTQPEGQISSPRQDLGPVSPPILLPKPDLLTSFPAQSPAQPEKSKDLPFFNMVSPRDSDTELLDGRFPIFTTEFELESRKSIASVRHLFQARLPPDERHVRLWCDHGPQTPCQFGQSLVGGVPGRDRSRFRGRD